MKHELIVEERYFSEDIKSLKDYNEGFGIAYDNGDSYVLTIQLSKLNELYEGKAHNKQTYQRLVTFLYEKGITLRILSRKRDKSIEKKIERN